MVVDKQLFSKMSLGSSLIFKIQTTRQVSDRVGAGKDSHGSKVTGYMVGYVTYVKLTICETI